jgi:cobalt-zinc-cadmium efflux system protein
MKTKRNIFIAFILNLFFSIFELIGGVFTGSVAIISDAVHDFGDAISIGTSFFLEKVSEKEPDKIYTFGYARFSVLGACITTLILLLSSGIVIYNAVLKIINPTLINFNGMIIFALVGLSVNLIATYFTHGGSSVNQKAVNLHMIEDVLGWLVVLIGAVVIKFTNLYVIDPILSLFVALFIIINCFKNLREILSIILIKTPKNIDLGELKEHLMEIEGVMDVHHLHVWTLDGQINLATMHVVVNDFDAKIKLQIKEELCEHDVTHSTIEFENANEQCLEKSCTIKRQACTSHCHHHH